MTVASTCPRCGAAFGCGVDGPGACPCMGPKLSADLRAALATQFTGCLCVPCLIELKAAHEHEHEHEHEHGREREREREQRMDSAESVRASQAHAHFEPVPADSDAGQIERKASTS